MTRKHAIFFVKNDHTKVGGSCGCLQRKMTLHERSLTQLKKSQTIFTPADQIFWITIRYCFFNCDDKI